MPYPGFEYHYESGTVRETTHFIGVRADPNLNCVEDFAVVLFFELPSGETIHVAKVDNTEHDEGRIHLHRNYRGSENVRDFDVEVSSLFEAEQLVQEHANEWVNKYLQNYERAER